MNKYAEQLERINNIPIKHIIEEFGGVFTNDKHFKHSTFGEKTSSCSIYSKGGKEYWKCFGRAIGGDAIDFVKAVCGTQNLGETIKKILSDDHTYKELTKEEKESYNKQLEKEFKEKDDRDRKKIYAIIKNSRPLIESNPAIRYFEKRGLLNTVLNFKNPNISILCNSYDANDGKRRLSIVYLLKGNEKQNLKEFIITKGIDIDGNKTGLKINVRESRPIIHMGRGNAPIIITEGLEDGLSGLALGYNNFMSLNSTSSTNRLMVTMNSCRKWFVANEFELAFDNDKAGIKATNDIKIFCNLASIYKKENGVKALTNCIKYGNMQGCNKDRGNKLINLINNIKDLEGAKPHELLDMVKLTGEVFGADYFNDFGELYKVRESEFVSMMKDINVKDLNELLVSEFKDSIDKVIGSLSEDIQSNEIIKNKNRASAR